jgi:hypothetical protein
MMHLRGETGYMFIIMTARAEKSNGSLGSVVSVVH